MFNPDSYNAADEAAHDAAQEAAYDDMLLALCDPLSAYDLVRKHEWFCEQVSMFCLIASCIKNNTSDAALGAALKTSIKNMLNKHADSSAELNAGAYSNAHLSGEAYLNASRGK